MLVRFADFVAFAAPPEGQGGGAAGWIFPLLIVLVFYFLLFAPMRKREKARQQMIAAIKPGDKVVTNGGIHGTVAGVTDDVVQLRIADKIKIDVSRSAIAALRDAQ